MSELRQMYKEPSHFVGYPDGDYPAWKVHADRCPHWELAMHLPKTDRSFKAAIVQDGYVVGVVREVVDAHPVAAPAAAPPATLPPPVAPVAVAAPAPVAPAPPAEPAPFDIKTANYPQLQAEAKRRGLPLNEGKRLASKAALVARLEA